MSLNGSGRSLRAPVAALLLLCSGCATVPGTGRTQLLLVTKSQENRLGLKAWDQILAKERISKDTQAAKLVTKVGRRIAKVAKRPDFKWEFKLFDSEQANAFCLPGGKIAVYTGLLKHTKDEDGLAAVIGHEVAHAIARHGGERLSQGMVRTVSSSPAGDLPYRL